MKPAKIKTSVSYSFMNRTCKACMSGPVHYLMLGTSRSFKCIRLSMKDKEYIKSQPRFCNNYYLKDDPTTYSKLSHFSYPVAGHFYSPKAHRTHTVTPKTAIIEYLMCSCGDTFWGFKQKLFTYFPELGLKRSQNTI